MDDFTNLFSAVQQYQTKNISFLYTTRIYRRVSTMILGFFASARGKVSSSNRKETIQTLVEADQNNPFWSANALSSKKLQDFSHSELLFRICALFSHPESLSNFPHKSVHNGLTQQDVQFLSLYAIILENLFDVDLSVVDQKKTLNQELQGIGIGFSPDSTLDKLYSAVVSGDFVVDEQQYALFPSSGEPSIFVDVLTSEYPLLSPSRLEQVNWLQLPPIVSFPVFLCAATLALEEPGTLRYMLKNQRLFANRSRSIRTSSICCFLTSLCSVFVERSFHQFQSHKQESEDLCLLFRIPAVIALNKEPRLLALKLF